MQGTSTVQTRRRDGGKRALSPRKARRKEIGTVRVSQLRQRIDKEIHSYSTESTSASVSPIKRSKSKHATRPVRFEKRTETISVDSENDDGEYHPTTKPSMYEMDYSKLVSCDGNTWMNESIDYPKPRLHYSMQELMDVRDLFTELPKLSVSVDFFQQYLKSNPTPESPCSRPESSVHRLNVMDSCVLGRRKSDVDRVKSSVPGYKNAKIFLEFFDAKHEEPSIIKTNDLRDRSWDTSETILLRTPNWKDLSLSRRRFQGQLSAWKKALHKFDSWSPPPPSVLSPCIHGLQKLSLNGEEDSSDIKEDEIRITPIVGSSVSRICDPTIQLIAGSIDSPMELVSPIQSYRKRIGFDDPKTVSSDSSSVINVGSGFSPTPPSLSRSTHQDSAEHSALPSWRIHKHKHRGFSFQPRPEFSSDRYSSSSISESANTAGVSTSDAICHWNWRKSESRNTSDKDHASSPRSMTSSTIIEGSISPPKAVSKRVSLKMHGYFSPITTQSYSSKEGSSTYNNSNSSIDIGSASQQRMSPVMICTSADDSITDIENDGQSILSVSAYSGAAVSPYSTPSQMCSIEAEYRRMMKVNQSDKKQQNKSDSKSPAWCMGTRLATDWLAPHGSSSSPSPSPSLSPSLSKGSFAHSLASFQSDADKEDESEDIAEGDISEAPVKLVSVDAAMDCLRHLLAEGHDFGSLTARLAGNDDSHRSDPVSSDDQCSVPQTEGFLALVERELHKL